MSMENFLRRHNLPSNLSKSEQEAYREKYLSEKLPQLQKEAQEYRENLRKNNYKPNPDTKDNGYSQDYEEPQPVSKEYAERLWKKTLQNNPFLIDEENIKFFRFFDHLFRWTIVLILGVIYTIVGIMGYVIGMGLIILSLCGLPLLFKEFFVIGLIIGIFVLCPFVIKIINSWGKIFEVILKSLSDAMKNILGNKK